MSRVPTASDFNRYRVTNPNDSEVLRQRLYDFMLYPAGGTPELNFFSLPIGQGVATAPGSVAGSQKTDSDTNLQAANMLPSGMKFQIESIEVVFLPGSSAAANTYTPAFPIFSGVTEGVAEANQARDIYTVLNSGLLELNVLQKNYLREPRLLSFPPKAYFDMDVSVATATAAADLVAANLKANGRPYFVDPEITINPAENFGVKLKWPGAVALPSTFNGRIGVILDGFMMRASQ